MGARKLQRQTSFKCAQANNHQAWEQVLGAFYNRGIDIGESERDGISYILESAGTILGVAEYLQNVSESTPLFTTSFPLTKPKPRPNLTPPTSPAS